MIGQLSGCPYKATLYLELTIFHWHIPGFYDECQGDVHTNRYHQVKLLLLVEMASMPASISGGAPSCSGHSAGCPGKTGSYPVHQANYQVPVVAYCFSEVFYFVICIINYMVGDNSYIEIVFICAMMPCNKTKI